MVHESPIVLHAQQVLMQTLPKTGLAGLTIELIAKRADVKLSTLSTAVGSFEELIKGTLIASIHNIKHYMEFDLEDWFPQMIEDPLSRLSLEFGMALSAEFPTKYDSINQIMIKTYEGRHKLLKEKLSDPKYAPVRARSLSILGLNETITAFDLLDAFYSGVIDSWFITGEDSHLTATWHSALALLRGEQIDYSLWNDPSTLSPQEDSQTVSPARLVDEKTIKYLASSKSPETIERVLRAYRLQVGAAGWSSASVSAVAKRSGLSTATVSRVLSNIGNVSALLVMESALENKVNWEQYGSLRPDAIPAWMAWHIDSLLKNTQSAQFWFRCYVVSRFSESEHHQHLPFFKRYYQQLLHGLRQSMDQVMWHYAVPKRDCLSHIVYAYSLGVFSASIFTNKDIDTRKLEALLDNLQMWDSSLSFSGRMKLKAPRLGQILPGSGGVHSGADLSGGVVRNG